MRSNKLYLFICIAVIFTSCQKDEEGSITLHFLPRYDGQPLETFKTYYTHAGDSIRFIHLSLLVSDMKLHGTSGEEFLKEIDLVDISFDDAASATAGFTVRIDDVPAATYNGLSLGIGVPFDQNSKRPANFPSSNPLSRTGYYWEAWNSFIFMKVEGRIETSLPGDFETSFAYHTGTDELYRVAEWNLPLTIEEGKNTKVNIGIDYADILEGVDIASHPQNHNPSDTVQIIKIVNNLQNAVSLFQ